MLSLYCGLKNLVNHDAYRGKTNKQINIYMIILLRVSSSFKKNWAMNVAYVTGSSSISSKKM